MLINIFSFSAKIVELTRQSPYFGKIYRANYEYKNYTSQVLHQSKT
jgi:hypothetical protein